MATILISKSKFAQAPTCEMIDRGEAKVNFCLPSLLINIYRWTEIGNSGMFRPEMLRPMGLPEDVRVIAWGLSLERPTMIKYRISNIRELFGHKAALDRTKAAPICQF